MHSKNSQFRDLCNAVVVGASDATQRFRHAVLPHLRIIVRRSLRLDRRRAAREPAPRSLTFRSSDAESRPLARNDEAIVDRKAQQLCDAMIESLRSLHGRPTDDTVVQSVLDRTLNLGAMKL